MIACIGAAVRQGWRVDVLTCEADAAEIAQTGARLLSLPKAALKDDFLDLLWREVFREELPDVIVDGGWPTLCRALTPDRFGAPVTRFAAAGVNGLEQEMLAAVQGHRAEAVARALVVDLTSAASGGPQLARALNEIERTLLVSWDERRGDYRLLFADELARLQASGGPDPATCICSTSERVSLAQALAAEGLGVGDAAYLLVGLTVGRSAARVERWFADRRLSYVAILPDEPSSLDGPARDARASELLSSAERLVVGSEAVARSWGMTAGGKAPVIVVESPPLDEAGKAADIDFAPSSPRAPLARRAALRQVRSRRDYALACRAHAMAGRMQPDEIAPTPQEPVSPVQTFLKPSGLEWEELLYPGKPPGDWQMSDAERMALTGLLARWRPKTYLEIGTFYGGSALLAAQFAEWVITIDIDPYAETRFVKPANLSFIAGRSQDMAADLLDDLAARDSYPDFILIDGDHSAEGVRRDLNIFLSRRPQRPTVIVMHDSFNPGCREGMRTADWAGCPWARRVELDFVPGRVVNVENNPFKGEMWGGLAVAILTPEANPHGAMIFTSAQDSFNEAMAQGAPRAA